MPDLPTAAADTEMSLTGTPRDTDVDDVESVLASVSEYVNERGNRVVRVLFSDPTDRSAETWWEARAAAFSILQPSSGTTTLRVPGGVDVWVPSWTVDEIRPAAPPLSGAPVS
jgi:hypothetical protein